MIEIEWKGAPAYTTKYFTSEPDEEVKIAEVVEDVQHAAPVKPKPVAPKRTSSKLTQQATIESAPPVTSSSSDETKTEEVNEQMDKVDEAEPESGIGTDDKIEETYEIVTEEDIKDIKSEEIQEEPKEHILVIGHDIHLNFDQPKETQETAAESTDVVEQVAVTEPTADEPEVQICEPVTEEKPEAVEKPNVTDDAKVSEEPEASKESEVTEEPEVTEDAKVSEEPEVSEKTVEVKSEPEVAAEETHVANEEVTDQTDKKSDAETGEQPESEETKKTEQNGPVRASSLTESEVAKAVIAQALENRVDEEDNKPAPRPVKDHTGN